jgi:hypothetical protein
VFAAIGGFHLFDATDETLEWTAAELRPMQLGYLVGAHCTGIEAVHRLRALLSLDRNAAVVGAVGASFDMQRGSIPSSWRSDARGRRFSFAGRIQPDGPGERTHDGSSGRGRARHHGGRGGPALRAVRAPRRHHPCDFSFF